MMKTIIKKTLGNSLLIMLTLTVILCQGIASADALLWQPQDIYSDTMECTVYATYDGLPVATDENSLVSAWIDGICVGLNLQPPSTTPYGDVFTLNINGESGKDIVFKVYDGAADTIYEITNTYTFIAFGNLGTAQQPQKLAAIPNWFENGRSIYSKSVDSCLYVEINSEQISTAQSSMISAWIGDICVGVNRDMYGNIINPTVSPISGITHFAFQISGEANLNVTFKTFDGDTGMIFECNEIFVYNDIYPYGTIVEPVKLTVEPPVYSVSFDVGEYGSIIQGDILQEVEYATNAVEPVILPIYGWKFVGWQPQVEYITSNIITQAQYEQIDFQAIECQSADLNGNNNVGVEDLYILLDNWLAYDESPLGDIDGNRWVNVWDFQILSNCWLHISN